MQQAERITESEVDIEKKKQELYSEIDALGIKSDSRINKLKKFLADRKIWHLEEMDYPLRNSYEQYLRGQIRSQIVSFYLKIYDTVKQQHIYQQMQTLNGKRIYEWKYQNKIYFLKYYPEKEIAETFETSYKTNLLVWDFTQNCSEVLKKQIFYTLSRIIANTSMSSVEETVYMEILKKLYLFPERLRCMFLHLWCLGLRASEVCTLKGNAYYQQGEDYWIQVYQVKMKNYKRIPIPQALYQIMKVYLKKHEIQPEEFIFKNSRGGACLYGTFRTQMIEACRENKIANGEYLFQSHDYRHTVATMFY